MSDAIKVTVSDPASGEVLSERVIENDYVLICAGRAVLAHTQRYGNGTHVLTVKGQPGQRLEVAASVPSPPQAKK